MVNTSSKTTRCATLPKGAHQLSGLLLANKLFHAEAIRVFYQSTTFIFVHGTLDLIAWPNTIPVYYRSEIKHIILSVDSVDAKMAARRLCHFKERLRRTGINLKDGVVIWRALGVVSIAELVSSEKRWIIESGQEINALRKFYKCRSAMSLRRSNGSDSDEVNGLSANDSRDLDHMSLKVIVDQIMIRKCLSPSEYSNDRDSH